MQKFTPIIKNYSAKTIFKNARIIDPESNYDASGDVLVENGIISDFGAGIFANVYPNDAEIIDCGGHVLCPGLLDIQVHFRTPGRTHIG